MAAVRCCKFVLRSPGLSLHTATETTVSALEIAGPDVAAWHYTLPTNCGLPDCQKQRAWAVASGTVAGDGARGGVYGRGDANPHQVGGHEVCCLPADLGLECKPLVSRLHQDPFLSTLPVRNQSTPGLGRRPCLWCTLSFFSSMLFSRLHSFNCPIFKFADSFFYLLKCRVEPF